MILVLLAIIWLGCSFLSYGIRFGYMRNKYENAKGEYLNDIWQCILLSFAGPFSLSGALTIGLAGPAAEGEKPRILKYKFKIL